MTLRAWISKNILFLITCVLALIIILITCTRPTPQPKVVTTRDTTVVIEKPIYVNPYQPVITGKDTVIYIKPEDKPQPDYSGLLAQYSALLQKHLETNKYDESIPLKDSAGNDRGTFNLREQVKENKVTRSYDYQLKYPVITVYNNITNPPPRQFFLGAAINVTQSTTNSGVVIPGIGGGKVGIAYQDRKYNFIHSDVSAINTPSGVKGFVEIGLYKPISSIFKKK